MAKSRAGAVRAAVGEAQAESAEFELRLGLQLRHARLVKGLRLRDVAERSGYSESLISKIENNKATPSLNTLHRIAKVLGKTIATLIGETASQRRGVVTKSFDRPVIPQFSVAGHGSDGTEAEVMVPLGSSSLMGAFVVRVKPGGSSDGLRHHEGEEVGFVRTGEFLLMVDGATYHLTEGEFLPLLVQPAARVHEPGKRSDRDHLGQHAGLAVATGLVLHSSADRRVVIVARKCPKTFHSFKFLNAQKRLDAYSSPGTTFASNRRQIGSN